jgi:hypothetical protein
MQRVYFDTNTGTDGDGYILWFDQSLRDLDQIDGGPKEGKLVLLYMDEELEIEATLKYDQKMKIWKGIPLELR